MDSFAYLVATAFGLGQPVDELDPVARGEQGRVWRLDTAEQSYAVKESFEPQTEAEAEADVSFQESILSEADVALPHPIRTAAGTVLAMAGQRQVRVYEWIDLLPPDRGMDPILVGATVAMIHRVRHQPARPLHPWYTDAVGSSTWQDLSWRLTASRAPFADHFAESVPLLVALEGVLQAPRHLQNCHRDLFADNVLPMAQGGLCVIDWENCGLEDPSHELAVVIFDFTAGDLERARTLHEAYLDAGGPGHLNDRGDFPMLIAQFGHFNESAAREWLDPASSKEDLDHAVGRFDEIFAYPLTMDLIDEILDRVAS